MKILYYKFEKYSDPEKIRKLLLDHIYSQTGELWNKHPSKDHSMMPIVADYFLTAKVWLVNGQLKARQPYILILLIT